jgi:hypothetical protein
VRKGRVHVFCVVDASGDPVKGALVAVARGTAATPEIAYRSADDGTVAIHLPDGKFHIVVTAPDGRTARTVVETAAAHPATIEIRLPRTSGGGHA